EQTQLLELPDRIATIALTAASAVQQELARVGIRWSVPRARIRALDDAKRRADEARVTAALGPDERALFEAARRGDVAAVRLALGRGVSHAIRTVEGQWEYTPAGDTPLIQACKANAVEAALALLAAGADPDARNRFEQTGLLWAARSG